MADPKTDTVRIALPARPEQAGADPSAAKHDPARIVLPSRPLVTPIRRLPPKITPSPTTLSLLQPLPQPQGIEPAPDATIRPSPLGKDKSATAASSVNRGPKKETARIHPTGSVAPADAIPRPLVWGLLAVSAVIFLIQIWNYVVS